MARAEDGGAASQVGQSTRLAGIFDDLESTKRRLAIGAVCGRMAADYLAFHAARLLMERPTERVQLLSGTPPMDLSEQLKVALRDAGVTVFMCRVERYEDMLFATLVLKGFSTELQSAPGLDDEAAIRDLVDQATRL
jgi:hypothetical protein